MMPWDELHSLERDIASTDLTKPGAKQKCMDLITDLMILCYLEAFEDAGAATGYPVDLGTGSNRGSGSGSGGGSGNSGTKGPDGSRTNGSGSSGKAGGAAGSSGKTGAKDAAGAALKPDAKTMRQTIYQRVADKDFEQRCMDYLAIVDLNALNVVMETDGHRIYNQAVIDAADQAVALFKEEYGAFPNMRKVWHTMMDEKVRMTHDYLEGMAVGLRDEFYTFDGDHAAAPGGFGKAENNVNCRCWITLNMSLPW